jgi:hypothetical protein
MLQEMVRGLAGGAGARRGRVSSITLARTLSLSERCSLALRMRTFQYAARQGKVPQSASASAYLRPYTCEGSAQARRRCGCALGRATKRELRNSRMSRMLFLAMVLESGVDAAV